MAAGPAAGDERLENGKQTSLPSLLLVAGLASLLYFAAVERHVKERLVGAAVLIAAAIILIPEMLSGPDRDARSEATGPSGAGGETPLKTYTIDLTKSPATQAAERAIDNRAPPAEVPATTAEPAPAPQANPESVQGAPEPTVAEGASKDGASGSEAAVAALYGDRKSVV